MASSEQRVTVNFEVKADTSQLDEALKATLEFERALERVRKVVKPTRAERLEKAIDWALNHILYAAPEVWPDKAAEAFNHLRRALEENEPATSDRPGS